MTKPRIPTLTERADYYNLGAAAEQGRLLPTVSAAALEDALQQNPLDVYTRARILGYFSKRKSMRDRRREIDRKVIQILWFIENVPACIFAGDKYLAVDSKLFPKQYALLKRAWKLAVSSQPLISQIKIYAAMFAIDHDRDLSTSLLRSVLRKSPRNIWAKELLKYLGEETKGSVERLQVAPATFDLEKFRSYVNKEQVERNLFIGAQMPPLSAKTLERVLISSQFDCHSRTELIGFYNERWERANVLGFDPEILQQLIRHLHWLIEHLAGSRLLATQRFWCAARMNAAPEGHSLLVDSWSRKIAEYSHDGATLLNAGLFFASIGNWKMAQKLERLSTACEINDPETKLFLLHRLTFEKKQRKRKSDNDTVKGHALESVSVDLSAQKDISISKHYTFFEWISEVDLFSARFIGNRRYPISSAETLEAVLRYQTDDVYNRAKLIGHYEAHCISASVCDFLPVETQEKYRFSKKRRASFLRHLKWFVDHAPESRYIATFPINFLMPSTDLRKLEDSMLRQIIANENNSSVLINFVSQFDVLDKRRVPRLIRLISKRNPAWGQRLRFSLDGLEFKVNVTKDLRKHSFEPGQRDDLLSNAADKLELWKRLPGPTLLPIRTIASNEYVISRNPNDLLLRLELVAAYEAHDQFNIKFGGHTPDVASEIKRHCLWFIQYVPEQYISYFTNGLSIFSREAKTVLADHATLLKAARLQLRAYPRNLNIALGLAQYYPLGQERTAIADFRELESVHPNNDELQRQMTHWRGLLSRRKRK